MKHSITHASAACVHAGKTLYNIIASVSIPTAHILITFANTHTSKDKGSEGYKYV